MLFTESPVHKPFKPSDAQHMSLIHRRVPLHCVCSSCDCVTVLTRSWHRGVSRYRLCLDTSRSSISLNPLHACYLPSKRTLSAHFKAAVEGCSALLCGPWIEFRPRFNEIKRGKCHGVVPKAMHHFTEDRERHKCNDWFGASLCGIAELIYLLEYVIFVVSKLNS